MTNSTFTIAQAEQLFREGFAPWIQEMDIRFDKIADGEALLRVVNPQRLTRHGDIICGQAIMALADSAMVFAVASAVGRYVPMTTVSQSTSFLRPAANRNLFAHAKIIKQGRSVVYGEVYLYTETSEKSAAHVTSTYMLL